MMSQQWLALTNTSNDDLAPPDQAIGQRIVSSLNFDSRPVRQQSLPQAHNDTFRWAFDSHLSDWLRDGDGAFWIAGKPGSGKSTFMKFIVNQAQTRELLTAWAGPSYTLATASHFFWVTGTPIQKSWQGLLQSLLFDVCRQHAALILPTITPSRWAAALAGDWSVATEPWSVTELTNAFRHLAASRQLPLRFCFFIDGLDEYDSDHDELCKVLRDLARAPHIKLCISSRPWDVFEQHFGDETERRLDIHDLTARDIRNFVADQLQSHPRWADAASVGTSADQTKIIENIASQADGVFIWAFFVTRSLRKLLSEGKSIHDLETNLRTLPKDLEALFKHILEQVRKEDRAYMAGVLQAAAHALEPLDVDIYWNIGREFVHPGHSLECAIAAAPPEAVKSRREETVRSVTEKTNDLLKFVGNNFEFLHRTVRDFVLTKAMNNYFRQLLPETMQGFHMIAQAYLGFLKTTKMDHRIVAGIMRVGPGQNSGPFISHLNHALIYAAESARSGQSQRQVFELLDEYDRAVQKMIRQGHVTVRGSRGCDPGLPFREELVRHDLTPYLASRLKDDSGFLNLFDESPLFSALTSMSLSSGESPAPVRGILQIMLQEGHNPNATATSTGPNVDEISPWVAFSRSVMAVFNMLSGPCMFPAMRWNETLNNHIFGLLLSHGADPNAWLLPGRAGSHTVFSHFLQISQSKFLGSECFKGYLEALAAFMSAGASLGVPTGTTGENAAFGNLARAEPHKTILASFCSEMEKITASLTGDPMRAEFIAAVIKQLGQRAAGNPRDLSLLRAAVLKGLDESHAQDVVDTLDKISQSTERDQTRVRKHRLSDDGLRGGRDKHFKSEW